MNKMLLNEIRSFMRLSNYDTKLTLTENVENLNEAGYNPAASMKGLESAWGSTIGKILSKQKMLTMDLATVTKFLEMDSKNFAKEFNRALSKDFKSGLKGELGPLSKDLSKIETFRRIAARSQELGGGKLKSSEILKIIDDVSNANKIKAAKFKPKVPKTKQPTPKPGETEAAIKEFERVTDPTKSKWDWKRLVKWGAGIGLSTAALYYLYTKTHGEEPPIVTDDGDGETPPIPPPVPKESKYKPCSGTYNVNVCKSNVIAQVQGCLGGLVQDGKFGPKTQAKLQSQFPQFASSFTDDDVDTICKKEGTNKLTTDVEDEELGSESSGTVDQSSNNQQTQTGGID